MSEQREREATTNELSIIKHLIKEGELLIPDDYYNELLLKKVGEKNMATFHLITPYRYQNRPGVNIASEINFTDLDGTDVLITLLANRYGEPIELDIWKIDGTPLMDLPSIEEIHYRKMIGEAFTFIH